MSRSKTNIAADEQAFNEALRELSGNYSLTLPDKIAQIEIRLQALLADPIDKNALEPLHRLVHSLNGSARTFGFPDVSDVAQQMETVLTPYLKKQSIPASDEVTQLTELFSELKSTVRQHDRLAEPGGSLQSLFAGDANASESNSIYLLETDSQEADKLEQLLARYGYDLSHYQTLELLQDAISKHPPKVILANMDMGSNSPSIAEQIGELAGTVPLKPDLIFISSDNSVSSRLRAVRAGSSAYCAKPLRIAELVDHLDYFTESSSAEPCRVLIVEDEPIHAEYCARILEASSIMSQIVTDPEAILTAMNEFNPDLVLMDMYLPGCTGDEIARVVRQAESFVSVPIVFLSVEDNFERQLLAMGHGGDEFLTKPITPSQLVSAVTTRVRRHRELRRLMMHDSLTGLVNHAHLQQQLELETARTSRTGRPLSFAMIDIDNFKQTNDRYGHPVGDRVLKNLARFLRQRLRKSDVVGRYGGEEFAIIMSNTNSDDAFQVVQRLREDFSGLATEADKETFRVTFSAGVASMPGRQNTRDLLLAADRALYRAKAQGRNKVVTDTAEDSDNSD